jgi:hypothetical protein
MNPAFWLALWIVATVVAATITGVLGYLAGYDKGHLDATDHDRGRHRAGHLPEGSAYIEESLVVSEAMGVPVMIRERNGEKWAELGEQGQPWQFFGGAQVEPQPGPAEYELLTQTAGQRCGWCRDPGCDGEHPAEPDESPSDFTRRHAAEVEAMIAGWEAQGNYDRHTIQAGER